MAKKSDMSKVRLLATGAILTAIVVIFQLLGSFIKFGTFSVSLVLVPIILGAAMCNFEISTWLGLVFGVVVLLSGDAGTFLTISPVGTVVTVLLKGTLAGLAAGLVYRFSSKINFLKNVKTIDEKSFKYRFLKKINEYFAVVLSAIVCPIVNTGVFLLGCRLFFYDTIKEWATGAGYADAGKYMIIAFVGFNFLFEMGLNIVLCPIVIRIMKAVKGVGKTKREKVADKENSEVE